MRGYDGGVVGVCTASHGNLGGPGDVMGDRGRGARGRGGGVRVQCKSWEPGVCRGGMVRSFMVVLSVGVGRRCLGEVHDVCGA